MILAFDTYYYDGKAKTVCLEFEEWNESKNFKIHTEIIENVEDKTINKIHIAKKLFS